MEGQQCKGAWGSQNGVTVKVAALSSKGEDTGLEVKSRAKA